MQAQYTVRPHSWARFEISFWAECGVIAPIVTYTTFNGGTFLEAVSFRVDVDTFEWMQRHLLNLWLDHDIDTDASVRGIRYEVAK